MTDPGPQAESSLFPAGPEKGAAYRVLARKYRPTRFADLIGQEVMVRTLSNAIATGRLAHAYVLTGVRGVGKTTTARIIARALNCIGPDGSGGPTADPCGVCEHCRAIAEDRHMDVIEMDAASRTGVDDIRELIDGVRYRPVSARYKIYIIDEVHMLSRQAFNALLKTLEEPPEHVKFIFATTEIRKVPVTVLSRCQRFDLARVKLDALAALLTSVAEREGTTVEAGAALLIARAAEGSVRDGLSLLDRAIAHAVELGAGAATVGEAMVRGLLGLADRSAILDLFEALMRGRADEALDRLSGLHDAGADPAMTIEDLLEIAHWLTRLKAAPRQGPDALVAEAERERGRALAEALSIPALARAWQILLKGLGEVQTAPNTLAAAEMLMVRLAYAAGLPTPAELIQGGTSPQGAVPAAASRAASRPPAGAGPRAEGEGRGGAGRTLRAPSPEPAPQPETSAEAASFAEPKSFVETVALFAANREAILHAHLTNSVHLVRFEAGMIEIRPNEHAPRDLAGRMMDCLARWTGRRWVVALSREAGTPTLAEQAAAEAASQRARAADHPLVRAVLEAFPGAKIEAVRRRDDWNEDAEAVGDEPEPGGPEESE